MERRQLIWVIFLCSIAGVLFSGYLTFSNLILGYCPLTESCPYLFNQPVCIYGFSMFSLIFLFSLITLFFKINERNSFNLIKGIIIVSFAGVLFSGYYSYIEISTYNRIFGYSLGLPSCVYGLIMYLIVFVLGILVLKKKASKSL